MPLAASVIHDAHYKYLELDRQDDVVLYGRIRRSNNQRNWVVCEHGAHPVHDAGSDHVHLYRRAVEARAAFAAARARHAAAVQVRYEDVDLSEALSAPTTAPRQRRKRPAR